MNILLAFAGRFGGLDDAERFYCNLMRGNPAARFYFFADAAGPEMPRNAHPLPLADHYRRNAGEFALYRLAADSPAAAIAGHGDELALLMDMAAAAPAIHFDMIDIPDFLALGAYFPECLKYFGISFDRIALSLLQGTPPDVVPDQRGDDSGRQAPGEHEELLYRCVDLRYGIDRRQIDGWSARTGLPTQLLDADHGIGLQQVYAAESQADPVAREIVGERFRSFANWLAKDFHRRMAGQFADRAGERCAELLSRHPCGTLDPAAPGREFRQAIEINQLWAAAVAPDGAHDWTAVDRAREQLNLYVAGGGRVNLYRLMAERERRRGNPLLYATYWLRIMRLSGAIPLSVLRQVMAILTEHGFSEEARVVAIMQRNDEEEIYDYLTSRADRLRTAPKGGIGAAIEFDRPQEPRVSVIVSVYRAADKIDTFVSGLERFTEAAKRITEFVFVDSASPDDTHGVLTERLRLAAGRGVGSLYLCSERRETIQRAWNRGIDASRGIYLAFLGVDEMDRPDGVAKMAAFLDRRPDVDWVQGSAVITEVNAAGSYVGDIMAYDRRLATRHMHYLDCCYISYVGGLYRKSIHEKAGFYDDQFRAAGDTEFKNRALPLVTCETLPETLGTYLNYPEERTTQSPTAELEDLRAWYLHRTAGGVRYAFANEAGEECVQQFRRALHYKKSYMAQICTDVDYALAIAAYLKRHRPVEFADIEAFIPNLVGLQLAYQRFDLMVPPEQCPGLAGFERIVSGLEHTWLAIAEAHNSHRQLGLPAEYRITNDNRWHQHCGLWPNKPSLPETQAVLDEVGTAEVEQSATVEQPAVPLASATTEAGGGSPETQSAIFGFDTSAATPTATPAPAADDGHGRLWELARQALAMIIEGEPIEASALGALCSLATAATAEELLQSLAAEVLTSFPRQGDPAPPVDALIKDMRAIIASYLGTADDATAVFSPALPFDIVDQAGNRLDAPTEAALRDRDGSWCVPMPRAADRECIRIEFDANLSVADHPGVLRSKGFYAVERQRSDFRWTGPDPTSTITLPLALTAPARLIIELGSTGNNAAEEDFTICCNGAVVSHTLTVQDRISQLTADLPPSYLTGPNTEIALSVEELTTPAAPDRRSLGVVFRSLTLLLGSPEPERRPNESGAAAASPG